MGAIKNSIRTFFNHKNNKHAEDSKAAGKVDENLGWEFNIFGEKNVKKTGKSFYFTHFILKYKIAYPIFYILENRVKAHKYTITDKWYDKNMYIFDKAWDNACFEFRYRYLYASKKIEDVFPDAKAREEWLSDNITLCKKQPIYRLKEFIVLMLGNDTAYREWLNIFMFNLHKAQYDVMDMAVFDTIYTESVREWKIKYAYHHTGMFFRTEEEKGLWRRRVNDHADTSPLARVKDLYLSLLVAYPEYKIWLFLLLENLKQAVDKEYEDKTIHHVFYSSDNIADVEYYNIGKDFFDNTFLHNLQDGSRILSLKGEKKWNKKY